jgi:hypothetical protein
VTDSTEDAPARRKPIPREAYRQERAKVWVRGAVVEDHIFLAYDRAQPRGDQSHLFQWRRGLRADTLDTELLTASGSFRFEFKAAGQKVKDDDGQGLMIRRLRALNVAADWGHTVADLCRFYRDNGVKLAENAEYQAMHQDALTDSRIAKAEGAIPGAKKPTRRKPTVKTSTVAWGRRARSKGIFL